MRPKRISEFTFIGTLKAKHLKSEGVIGTETDEELYDPKKYLKQIAKFI